MNKQINTQTKTCHLFEIIQEIAYKPNNVHCDTLTKDHESKDYQAATTTINNKRSILRTAKKTPTKIGQLVTFWKRDANNVTIPYDTTDLFEFFIVSVEDDCNRG